MHADERKQPSMQEGVSKDKDVTPADLIIGKHAVVTSRHKVVNTFTGMHAHRHMP